MGSSGESGDTMVDPALSPPDISLLTEYSLWERDNPSLTFLVLGFRVN